MLRVAAVAGAQALACCPTDHQRAFAGTCPSGTCFSGDSVVTMLDPATGRPSAKGILEARRSTLQHPCSRPSVGAGPPLPPGALTLTSERVFAFMRASSGSTCQATVSSRRERDT